MDVQELFSEHLMGADSSLELTGINGICGFLPSATGTIAVTNNGVAAVAATAVTAGIYCPIPMKVKNKATVTLAGGAAGTLFTL